MTRSLCAAHDDDKAELVRWILGKVEVFRGVELIQNKKFHVIQPFFNINQQLISPNNVIP